MKNNILVSVLLSIALFSCNPTLPIDCEDCGFQCLTNGESNVVTNNCFLYDDCGFKYYFNSRIDISEDKGFSEGQNKVFEFTTSNDEVAGIRASLKNTIIFEVDDNLRVFEYNGEDFNRLNVQFRRESSSGNIGYDEVKIGCIAGEQQANGVWFVYGKINVPNVQVEESLKFEARFEGK